MTRLAGAAGVKGTITTDVVKADLPSLLGMPVLKRAKIVINFDTDEAVIFERSLLLKSFQLVIMFCHLDQIIRKQNQMFV